ncbi:MAG: hypothetical protein M3365_09140, partial [Gemmatimonadota bacterium]|nr:hypothetical protein [Gemmatimonadota bacterium]
MSTTLQTPLILPDHQGTTPSGGAVTRNRLLKLLPPSELESLLGWSEMVTVMSKEIIFKRGAAVPYVHFPEN